MKALPRSSLILGVPLLVALVGALAAFLYVVLLGGPWTLFLWASVVSFALVIKALALARLDDERQMLDSAMLWELFSGVTGWGWMILALSSFLLFVRALFFGGSWRAFFVCFGASALCKWLTRYALTWKQGAIFKRTLAQQGFSKDEARKAWIAEAERQLKAR